MPIFQQVRILHDTQRQFRPAVDLRDLGGTDVTGFTTYTVVTKIRRTENLESGSRIKVRIRAPNTANGSLSAIYIGEVAASGNAYDFSATPTQLTFNGATSLTMAAYKEYTSDTLVYDFNLAKAHLIAMNVSATTLRRLTAPANTRGVVSYYKAATSEASTVAKASGYTVQADTSYGISLISASRTPNETFE